MQLKELWENKLKIYTYFSLYFSSDNILLKDLSQKFLFLSRPFIHYDDKGVGVYH